MSIPALALPILWAAVIFIGTCNLDPSSILAHPFLFKFNPGPKFSDLFIISDIEPANHFYQLQKTGHLMSFALLYIFVFHLLKKYKAAFILCASYSLLTEILQLFFYRDGRLFDVLIDLTGIILALFICKLLFHTPIERKIGSSR